MREIFVFGSNLAGRHGAGAAKAARLNHGAIYGKASGIQGNSYAIPTKNAILESLNLKEINRHVKNFIQYAKDHSELVFNVTPIGCGLAGYQPKEIAPMFSNVPENVNLPEEFKNA